MIAVADNQPDDEICVRRHGRDEASRLAFEVATLQSVADFLGRIRESDAFEIRNWLGEEPAENVAFNAAMSAPYCWVMKSEGRTASIWGLFPEEDGSRMAWMFSSDLTRDVGLCVAKTCRRQLRALKDRFRIRVYGSPEKKDMERWNSLLGFCFVKWTEIEGIRLMEFEV